ncbi:M28 family peptidase [Aeoliella sp. ICT_H6.2]|uniref:M28 family peptidase n=1 Tax=Aeoliella straminimaris TaxID=2954799 RepID=A0A9X2F5L7_9BACT|nr:M28 family peptidase [Aeoliella straminimaris]
MICALVASHAGCSQGQSPGESPSRSKPAANQVAVKQPASVTPRNGSRENPLSATRAMSYLEQICKLGQRPSGSTGMIRQQSMLQKFFEKHGAKVSRQEFFVDHPLTGRRTPCANLVIEWNPEAKERVLLCAHYDTRPLPDRDPDPRARREGVFIGANDGASGVAVLMELAHQLEQANLNIGVDMVLFDAEELVFEDYRGQRGDYFEGSTYFARQYRENPPQHRYKWGVLMDMVGDKKLELMQEKFSMTWPDTRPLVLDIWNTAARLGVKEFVPRTKRGRDQGFIRDDHVPLRNIARIPTCDIIDADYPDAPFGAAGSYWHTEQDLPKHCSGESLAKVGWVVLEWLKSVEPGSK